ncbi:MAG: hypothetical protein ACFCVK_12080 [Acidimicrobiales bacterium]
MNDRTQGRVMVEFTVEPFTPADPGPHVTASIEAARRLAGPTVEVGPFGTAATVPSSEAPALTSAVVDAALANGATRVSLQLSTLPDPA